MEKKMDSEMEVRMIQIFRILWLGGCVLKNQFHLQQRLQQRI